MKLPHSFVNTPYSKKPKVGIQESSSESEMETEFVSDDSEDDVSDRQQSVYSAQDFSRMINMATNGRSV